MYYYSNEIVFRGHPDKIFDVVDKMTDSFATVSDKIVDGLSGIVSKLVSTTKKRKVEIEDEEDD